MLEQQEQEQAEQVGRPAPDDQESAPQPQPEHSILRDIETASETIALYTAIIGKRPEIVPQSEEEFSELPDLEAALSLLGARRAAGARPAFFNLSLSSSLTLARSSRLSFPSLLVSYLARISFRSCFCSSVSFGRSGRSVFLVVSVEVVALESAAWVKVNVAAKHAPYRIVNNVFIL